MLELSACVCKVTPDKAECKQWNLTPKQWRQCVMALLNDAGVDMCFESLDNDTGPANTVAHRQAMTKDEAHYIFGITITDNEASFMQELCKSNIDLYKASCLLRARQSNRKKYNLSEK